MLKKEILKNGGKIYLNKTLTKVEQNDSKITGLYFNNDKKKNKYRRWKNSFIYITY